MRQTKMPPIPSGLPEDSSRISPRYAFETRIRIKLQRNSQELVVGGWARDISESGIGAFVAEELLQGEQVDLEVPFGNNVLLNLQARVSRNLGTQYGLMFTAVSSDQRRHIQAAMAEKAPLPSPFLPKE
jgi:PilZ domain